MTQLIKTELTKTAVISDCGRYRYELTRQWDDGPQLRFIMLNPSTADADIDDPTIRRCVGFARRWGYGSLIVHNLYAYRSTNPFGLVNLDDPIGPENRKFLSHNTADLTIVGWGAHPTAVGWWNGYPYGWQKTVLPIDSLYCLGVNADGSPKHPLYLPNQATPVRWVTP